MLIRSYSVFCWFQHVVLQKLTFSASSWMQNHHMHCESCNLLIRSGCVKQASNWNLLWAYVTRENKNHQYTLQPGLFASKSSHVGQFQPHAFPLLWVSLWGAFKTWVSLKGNGWAVWKQSRPRLFFTQGGCGGLQDQPALHWVSEA